MSDERLKVLSEEFADPAGSLSWADLHELAELQAAAIKAMQEDLDRKMGRRSDCTICGETVPFVGAVFCSEQCWRTGKDGS